MLVVSPTRELALQIALGGSLMAVKGFSAPEVSNVCARARELCRQGVVGQTEEGIAVLDEALATVLKTEERHHEAELYRLAGELTLQQESQNAKVKMQKSKVPKPKSQILEPESEAEACFLKAIAIARRQQAKSFELRATVSLVRLWQQQGKHEEAHQRLSEVYDWFTEGFDTKDLQEAKALLDALSQNKAPERTTRNLPFSAATALDIAEVEEHAVLVTGGNTEQSPKLRLVVNKGKSSSSPSPATGKRPRTRS